MDDSDGSDEDYSPDPENVEEPQDEFQELGSFSSGEDSGEMSVEKKDRKKQNMQKKPARRKYLTQN